MKKNLSNGLIFIDESGDPGLKLEQGSSRYFTVYKYACGLVFESAKEKLSRVTVVVDKSGNMEFRNQLAVYLRRKMNIENRFISKVKMQRSSGNNLLQLADYVAGVINRSIIEGEKKNGVFRKIIAHREMRVQIWPK